MRQKKVIILLLISAMDGNKTVGNGTGKMGLGYSQRLGRTESSSSSSSSSSSCSSSSQSKSEAGSYFWDFQSDSDESERGTASDSSDDSDDDVVTQKDCYKREEAVMELVSQELSKLRPVTNVFAARYALDLVALYFNGFDALKEGPVMAFIDRKGIDLTSWFSMDEIMRVVRCKSKLDRFNLERSYFVE